jgi:hypothetical protein
VCKLRVFAASRGIFMLPKLFSDTAIRKYLNVSTREGEVYYLDVRKRGMVDVKGE